MPDPRPSLTAQVRSLVLVARRGYPHWDERALTMAPERFAQLDPPDELIEAPDPAHYAPRPGPRWDGCDVLAVTLLIEVVASSPVLPPDSGPIPRLPPGPTPRATHDRGPP